VSETPILYEVVGAVAYIRLNRPEAQNTLTPALVSALDGALDESERNDSVRVVVITGVGEAFCGGADLTSLGPLDTYEVRMNFGKRMLGTGAVFRHVEQFPKPVIAAVNGLTLAGGLELLLCCDLVLAARSALIGEGHSTHGQLPGGGASVRLPRKMGSNRAKYLMFTGALLPAQTLCEWGVVNEVVDDDQLQRAVGELALLLAEKSPLSLRWMKRLVDDGLEQPVDSALRLEILAAELNLGSGDMAEGLQAIREGRPPKFSGR
jgi:enoyl-CoA hydratase/carnithine racemase